MLTLTLKVYTIQLLVSTFTLPLQTLTITVIFSSLYLKITLEVTVHYDGYCDFSESEIKTILLLDLIKYKILTAKL
jgi:hypothetical protein